MRISEHREHPFRSIVNTGFGVVHTFFGIVNTHFGVVNTRFGHREHPVLARFLIVGDPAG